MRPYQRTAKPDGRRAIGLYGERQAAEYLEDRGYRILDRNWRCRAGELDIVARHESAIVFVEVRTRRAGGRFGTAVESVDGRKRLQVRSIAEVYLSMNKLHGTRLRFDVIAITLRQTETDSEFKVEELRHVEAAF
ncbi:YraN family protein [Paenibacillus sp. GCM10023250]|uniref:YraN family protein n=1 Tax=Paenibacillus sp. GCM10023250 TaxID=3252648 RepID=UPI0036147ADE